MCGLGRPTPIEQSAPSRILLAFCCAATARQPPPPPPGPATKPWYVEKEGERETQQAAAAPCILLLCKQKCCSLCAFSLPTPKPTHPSTSLYFPKAANFVLYESASGYALFEVVQHDDIAALTEEVQASVTDLQRFGRTVKLKVCGCLCVGQPIHLPTHPPFLSTHRLTHPLHQKTYKAFQPFTSAENALENMNSVSEHVLSDDLKNFLELNLPKAKKAAGGKMALGVIEPALGYVFGEEEEEEEEGEDVFCPCVLCFCMLEKDCVSCFPTHPPTHPPTQTHSTVIQESLSFPCKSDESTREIIRGIRLHFNKYVKELDGGLLERSQLGLGHSYSRAKVGGLGWVWDWVGGLVESEMDVCMGMWMTDSKQGLKMIQLLSSL